MTCTNPALPDHFQCSLCSIGKSVFRFWNSDNNLDFVIEREIWKQKSVFKVDFLLYPSIGKSRKGIEKLFRWTLVLFTLLMHVCVKLLFNEQFSQCWNPYLFGFCFRLQIANLDFNIQIQISQFNAPLTWILKSCFYSTAVIKIYMTNAKIKINCMLCIIICSLQWKPIKCS